MVHRESRGKCFSFQQPKIGMTYPQNLNRKIGGVMANRKGTGLMLVGADIPADKEGDFNKWYQEEHLQELSINLNNKFTEKIIKK